MDIFQSLSLLKVWGFLLLAHPSPLVAQLDADVCVGGLRADPGQGGSVDTSPHHEGVHWPFDIGLLEYFAVWCIGQNQGFYFFFVG